MILSEKGGDFLTIGEKIYKLRTEKNLSQGDLAEILDVSYEYICQLTTENALRVFGKLH